jgi:PhoH-like ATPase
MRELIISQEQLNELFKENKLLIDTPLNQNEYLILKGEISGSALAKHKKPLLTPVKDFKIYQGVKPKDAHQKFFFDSVADDQILMTVVLGKAGTGKTLLAIAYALEQYFKENKTIVLIKPTVFVGGKSSVMGPVPGDVNDKLAGTMSSFMVHMNALLGHKASFILEDMLDKGNLKLLPIEQARGMNLENCTVILDEAQNCDIHAMKTIVSRVASNSKLIALGDLSQIDAPFRRTESGLHIFIESKAFKDSIVTSQITLTTQYRSALADLCEAVSEEYYKDK